ncbi:MAG: hypothetical protein WCG80_17285 [Spirochaetales bacterium]
MKLRPHFAAYLALIAVFGLTSCGTRYYSATVSGYVKDASFGTAGNATGAGNAAGGGAAAPAANGGINDAEIRIYLTDPSVAGATYLVKSATASSGGNNGFWSHKITWETSSPKFSDTGDSGTVWIQVQRMGYFPKTVKVTGVLSDSTNLVPTIEMTLIKTTEVRGKVVNEKGNAINGVNVVLDLGSTTANDADFTVATASVDGEDGVFVFRDVPWNDADSIPSVSKGLVTDAASGNVTATETIRLYINDANYYADKANHDNYPNNVDAAYIVSVTSGAKKDLSSTPIEVRSTSFSIPELRGRLMDAQDPTHGLNGVQVSVHIPASNANADPNVTTATVGTDGWFVFNNLRWTNVHPNRSQAGSYDDSTAAQLYVSGANFYSTNDATNPLSITLKSDQALNISTGASAVTLSAGKATFKKASIKGKLVLAGSSTGVNGVTVSLNLADNNAPNGAYSVTTGNDGTSDGIFEFKNVTWVNTKPLWGDVAKTQSKENIEMFVNDNNYTSPNVAASPYVMSIVSDPQATASNPTPTTTGVDITTSSPLSVKRVTFNVPKITGKVVTNASGNPVIGNVQVSLTLKAVTPTNGPNNNAQPATVTTDSNGIFTFSNVTWTNNSPTASNSDSPWASIQVIDANYSSTTLADVQLTSDSALDKTGTPITVTRTKSWNFTTVLQGKVQQRATPTTSSTASYLPISGQQVKIALALSDATPSTANGNVSITGGTLTLTTDNNGQWTTGNLTWSRDAGYVPSATAQQAGGDTLTVEITYPPMAGHSLVFADTTSLAVNSWQNTNNAPIATDNDNTHN